VAIVIDETTIPVLPAVAAASEMLGFDPLYIANEGKLLCIVAPEDAAAVLAAMQATPHGAGAVRIGTVRQAPQSRVLMKTAIGSTRVVDMLAGEMLPRIC
jgi:hydrogenase expression/formation protein HypE